MHELYEGTGDRERGKEQGKEKKDPDKSQTASWKMDVLQKKIKQKCVHLSE